MSRPLPTYALLTVGILTTFGQVGCNGHRGKVRCNHGHNYHQHHGSVEPYGSYPVGDSIYPVQPGTIQQGQPLSVTPTPGLGGEPMPAPAPLPDGNTIPAPPKPRPLESRGNDVTFPTAHEGRRVVPTRSRRARSPRLFDRLGNGFRNILKPVAFRRASPSHSQQVADPFFAVPSNHPRLTLPQHTTDHSPESLMVGHSVINNRRADPAPLHQPKPEFSTTPNPWKPSQLRQASPSALAAAPLSVPSDKPVAAITHWPYIPRVLAAEQTDARPIAMPTISRRDRGGCPGRQHPSPCRQHKSLRSQHESYLSRHRSSLNRHLQPGHP